MNKITLKNILYFFMISCFLSSCSQEEKKETEPSQTTKIDPEQVSENVQLDPKQLTNAGVLLGNASVEQMSGEIALHGNVVVAPQSTVNLSFPIGGYIKSTSMLPGKPIKKGQTLAIIEDMQFIQLQQDYLTAHTNSTLAETEYQRQHELNQSKASSDKVLQQAKADMDRAHILVSSLAEKLRLIGIDSKKLSPATIKKEVPILSPTNGYITKVNVAVGKYTAPTDILFEIVNPSDIYLSLKVFEKDLPKIAVGSKLAAYLNTDVDRKIPAVVFLINRTFDENRMADVLCRFQQNNTRLAPGIFMNADLYVDKTTALVVPEEAVVRWQNKYFIFVQQQQGSFRMTEVKVGILHAGKLQIISDQIDEHVTIVLKNAFALLMKAQNKEE